MDGILNINKPAGITSYGVVAAVKRCTGERHVGHAGTLDPDATGVLPVCLGKGTRVIEFLMDTTKVYRAVIELGKATDTYDAAGQTTFTGDASNVTRAQLDKALESFRGAVTQTPPMYSAARHQGQKLYELAREGVTVERKSRTINISRLDLLDWQPPLLTLEIECSKGTYIRSIANDLGAALGCGAHLKELIRARVGVFKLEDALTLEQLNAGDWQKYLLPIDIVLQDMLSFTVDAVGETTIKTGNTLTPGDNVPAFGESLYCRAYSADGRFIAILKREGDVWHPKKVLI
jgi:tRNA pseudouridine55 synthase